MGGSQEPPHQGPGAAAKKAKEGGIDAGEEAGRAGQEEEEEEDVDHRFDQVVGKEEVVEDQAEGEEEGDLGLDGEQEVDDAAAGAGGEAKGDGYDESEDASQEDELEGEEGWNEEELGAEGGHGGREGLPAEGAQEAGRGVEVKELPPSDGGGEAAGQQGEAVLIAQDHLKGGRRGEEEEAEAAEAEEEPDNKERDGQQPDRLHPFVEDVDYGADEGQEQGAAALHSDAVEGADAKGDVSQRYQDTEDNKAASQLQVPADDEGRGDEEEGIVEGVQEEAVQLQASVKDRQARTWKPKGEIREEGRGASQLQVPVGEESRNRLPRTGGKGGDAFDAERHLLAVGGGPKERYLSRQHARSRAAGGPSKERIFAESVLKPSVGGFVPNKQFSFLDNSLRPTSRRRPPPPPSASSARQAAPQGAQQQIQPSWEVAEGPQGKQKQQHGLSRPSRGHWQQQQQQQGSPSSGIPEAVPSKEMVKAFQGVAKAAGAFNSDGTSKSLKGAEKQLSACFRYLEKCEIPPETVAEGMARLAGFKKLSKTVTCPAAHVAGPSDCARLAGNPEQPAKHQGQRDQQDKKGRGPQAPVWLSPLEPGREGRARHASCAVVGNSRGLTNSDFHGAAIDAHDAVFRVNLAPTRLYEPYVGNRTTYRVLDADTLKVSSSPRPLQLARPRLSWGRWQLPVSRQGRQLSNISCFGHGIPSSLSRFLCGTNRPLAESLFASLL